MTGPGDFTPPPPPPPNWQAPNEQPGQQWPGSSGPPLSAPRHSLRRSTTDRKVSGLIAGAAQYLGLDANALRVAFIIASVLLGGLILPALYVVGWAMVPEDNKNGPYQGASVPTRTWQDWDRSARSWALVLLCITLACIWSFGAWPLWRWRSLPVWAFIVAGFFFWALTRPHRFGRGSLGGYQGGNRWPSGPQGPGAPTSPGPTEPNSAPPASPSSSDPSGSQTGAGSAAPGAGSAAPGAGSAAPFAGSAAPWDPMSPFAPPGSTDASGPSLTFSSTAPSSSTGPGSPGDPGSPGGPGSPGDLGSPTGPWVFPSDPALASWDVNLNDPFAAPLTASPTAGNTPFAPVGSKDPIPALRILGRVLHRLATTILALFMALVLAAVIAIAAVVHFSHAPFRGGIGERNVAPNNPASVQRQYNLATGRLDINLAAVKFPPAPRTINANVGVGQLDIVVPPGTTVVVNASTGLGDVDIFGQKGSSSVDTTSTGSDSKGPVITLNAHVGVGNVDISRG